MSNPKGIDGTHHYSDGPTGPDPGKSETLRKIAELESETEKLRNSIGIFTATATSSPGDPVKELE